MAIIHRPRYDDWSLPKGKVDPGETEPVTAVREVQEETGYTAALGRRLAGVSYPVEQGIKKVRYWAARQIDGDFAPNAEVDALVWLPVAAAINQLGYPHDRKVLRRFARYPVDTQTVLIVRHGTAGSKSRYKGDDRKRPLDKHGRAQAESLVGQLLAFGAGELYAADRLRCHQTLEPLAEELGVSIHNEPALTEEAYSDDRKRGRQRVLEIAAAGGTPVICTQGKVIPDLIGWWCDRDGVRPDKSRNRKGSTWVLSLSEGRLVAADHIGSPLAAQEVARSSAGSLNFHADTPRVELTHGVPDAELTCGPSWPAPCGPGPLAALGGCLLDRGLSGHGLGSGLLRGGLLDGLLGGSLSNGLLGGNRLSGLLAGSLSNGLLGGNRFSGLLRRLLSLTAFFTAAFRTAFFTAAFLTAFLAGPPAVTPRFTAGPSAGRRCAPETTALN